MIVFHNKMKSVLIFDYDGVLVDSLDLFMDLFIRACQNEGWGIIESRKSFLRLFEGNMFEQMQKNGMSKNDILRIVLQVKEGLLQNYELLSIFPNVKETLKLLSKNYTMLISTSNDSDVVKKVLKQNNLLFFQEIYGSDKHHSKIEKMLMIKEKFPNHKYVYIGDTTGDIIEGKKANVETVAVTWGWHSKEELIKTNPDFLISSPDELLSIFKI